MLINFLQPKFINKIKPLKITFTSNPILKEGIKSDSFEKRNYSISEQATIIDEIDLEIESLKADMADLESNLARHAKEQIIKEEIDKLKEKREKTIAKFNPNVAFLSDSSLSWKEKRERLWQQQEIIPAIKLPRVEDCAFDSLWRNSDYFIMNKTNIGNFLDSTYEANIENYKRLSQEGVISYSEFAKKYGFDVQEIYRYVKEGFLQPLTLRNLISGDEIPVHIFDDEANIVNLNGIERHNKIRKLVSQSPYCDKNYLPVKYFAKLGFGDEKELLNSITNGKLKGKIIPTKTKDGIKDEQYIAYKSLSAMGWLKYLRNQNKNLMSFEDFAKLTRVDITDMEEALLEGEVQAIPHYIYKDDANKVLINLKHPKNIAFLEKKNFEYEMVKNENKEKSSVVMKTAWALSHHTQEIKNSTISKMPEVKEIFSRMEELKDYLKRKEKGELKEGELEPKITRSDRIKIKTFYKIIWQEAGMEEFRTSIKRAKIGYKEYKEKGLDNVSDIEVKEIIRNIISKK